MFNFYGQIFVFESSIQSNLVIQDFVRKIYRNLSILVEIVVGSPMYQRTGNYTGQTLRSNSRVSVYRINSFSTCYALTKASWRSTSPPKRPTVPTNQQNRGRLGSVRGTLSRNFAQELAGI